MVSKADFTSNQAQPLHIENTVLQLGREDLRQGKAFETYREMKLDGVVSGSMAFIKGVMSKQFPTIKPHEKSTEKEKQLIAALNTSLNSGEVYSPLQYLHNWFSMLDYGVSLNEMTFKRKGGLFVFDTITPIHLSNVNKFYFDRGRLVKIELTPAENDGNLTINLDRQQKEIKGDKILMFRNESDSDFPLGKSLLYGAYTSWKTKKILQEYEAIGVAKNLSGVLKLRIPSDYINAYLSEPASDEALYVQNLIDTAEMLHAGKGSYALVASDVNQNGVALFDVDTIGGSGGNAQNYNVGSAIERYNREILLNMQTSVLAMGQEGGGSFALSDNQTNFLTLFIEYLRSEIGSGFRKAFKEAWKINGMELENMPTLEWPEVQTLDWDEFTKGWNRLLSAGGVTPTEELEAFLRKFGGAPEADYSKVLQNETTADESLRADDAKEK